MQNNIDPGVKKELLELALEWIEEAGSLCVSRDPYFRGFAESRGSCAKKLLKLAEGL